MGARPAFTFQELIHQRGTDAATRDKVVARQNARTLTYGELEVRSVEQANVLASWCRGTPRKVAVLMRNDIEFLVTYGASAYAGAMIFLVNTSLGGSVLEQVLARSGADVIIVDREHLAKVEAALPALGISRERVLVVGEGGNLDAALKDTREALGDRVAEPPDVGDMGPASPWMVIYTSGTTGVPKGVISSHGKVRGIGLAVAHLIGLRADDVGYVSMPLFHSNAVWLNWIPAMQAGASIAIRERFTASGFVQDVFEYGATFWNYVGQPVHYVLEAIEAAHGGDRERIRREVAEHPKNSMRMAVGTGASGSERRRFIEYLGLDWVYENYGSTEAEITAWCMPGDPIDSVGEVADGAVTIIDEAGNDCPPLDTDASGNPTNYLAAVGEIARRGTMGLFQGYHDLPDASAKKVKDGIYHSGDLGAIREIDGKRYLYFIGRTDDWIRKDGENFSAETVVDMVKSFPGVDRAAAYGAPHPVSDEWVMVAIRMRAGASFDPKAFYDHCRDEVTRGRDLKWLPDFVRVVDDFEWTETHKIKVRMLKGVHYHPDRTDRVWFRERGDETFRPFGRAEFERLEADFAKSGRSSLLVPR